MRDIVAILGMTTFFLCLAATPARAEQGHCHNKGPANELVAADDLDTKQACDEEGGIWFVKPQHCHVTGRDGKIIELTTPSSPQACAAKGGTWIDHGRSK